MSTFTNRSGFDGTTGGSSYGGRRTHVIQLLRDSTRPLTVQEVAQATGIHVNTARFSLESLVDAGFAARAHESRSTPGRPKVLYVGTLPNQTHERAPGYRLLAETLAVALSSLSALSDDEIERLGMKWGLSSD